MDTTSRQSSLMNPSRIILEAARRMDTLNYASCIRLGGSIPSGWCGSAIPIECCDFIPAIQSNLRAERDVWSLFC